MSSGFSRSGSVRVRRRLGRASLMEPDGFGPTACWRGSRAAPLVFSFKIEVPGTALKVCKVRRGDQGGVRWRGIHHLIGRNARPIAF